MSWANNHMPTKYVEDDGTMFGGPLRVRCSCGWQSDVNGKWAMDQFRAHYSSGITQPSTAPVINTKQRTKRSRLR